MTRIKRDSIISFLALCALFTSCASAQKETITVEKKKGGVTDRSSPSEDQLRRQGSH